MKKTLVIYYSHDGNTKFVADAISKKLEADIIEIKPIKELNVGNGFMKYFWLGRHVIMKSKPEIEKININLDDYENIFLGSPVWAFTMTPPIRTFLDKNKMKDKDMYLFVTHEGSFGKVFKDMTSLLKDNHITSEKAFKQVKNNKEQVLKDIDEWLNSIIIK